MFFYGFFAKIHSGTIFLIVGVWRTLFLVIPLELTSDRAEDSQCAPHTGVVRHRRCDLRCAQSLAESRREGVGGQELFALAVPTLFRAVDARVTRTTVSADECGIFISRDFLIPNHFLSKAYRPSEESAKSSRVL